MVFLTVSDLYKRVSDHRSEGRKCDVAIAYFEPYNEVFRDLFCPCGSALSFRSDISVSMVVPNVSTHRVKEANSLLELLLRGTRSRIEHAISHELFDEASAAGCLQLMEAVGPNLERDEQLAEMTGLLRMFAALEDPLGHNSEHWESLNASALPYLRSLHEITEFRNSCRGCHGDVHAAAVRKARGPGVTWADELEPMDSPSLTGEVRSLI